MRYGYDQRWAEAHKEAQRLADLAYDAGPTPEERSRRYYEAYNKHMADFAREEEKRVPKEIDSLEARFLKGYADGTAEVIRFTAARCPQCGAVIPTGDRCCHCEGI